MEAISSRNLLKVLPFVNVQGGFYRVNRRKVIEIRPGKVSFDFDGGGVPSIVGASLKELPSFKTIDDSALLDLIAGDATVTDIADGADIVSGATHTHINIIVKGKVSFHEEKDYHEDHKHPSLGVGHYFGEGGLFDGGTPLKQYTATADTKVQLLQISYADINTRLAASANHTDHIVDHAAFMADLKTKMNRKGESLVAMYAGLHEDDVLIPSTFVEYDLEPDEIELFTGQTILKVHTKVADLYNNPHNQTEEQVRLTVEELKEAQEYEMINNPNFGLLSVAHFTQRIHTRTGPPTPSDMDELLSK